MKSFLFPFLAVLALAFTVGGCQKTAAPPDKAVFFQTIEDNVHALDKKDVDAVMATIHPQAPSFDSTREVVAEMFKAVDLKYTLSDLKLLSATEDEARVSFVQKTEKVGDKGGFQDNVVQGIHILRPDNGKWKIFRTLNLSVTDPNGRPLLPPVTPEEAEAAATLAPEPAAPTPAPEASPASEPANPPSPPAPQPAQPAEKPAQ